MKISKRKILFCWSFIACALLTAQPMWIESGYRSANYPASVFYSAYVDQAYTSEPNEMITSLKEQLRAQVASEIKVSVKSQTEINTSQVNGNFNKSASQDIISTSDLELTGLTFESYINEEQKKVFAFAYANRFEIAAYFKANINIKLQQVDSRIAVAESNTTQGELSKAVSEYQAVETAIADIKKDQDVLLAVSNGSTNGVQSERTLLLEQKTKNALVKLEQQALIYLSCSAKLTDGTSVDLGSKVTGLLSAKGFRFTKNMDEALWLIDIKGNARDYNLTQGIYFSYASASYSLTNAKLEQQVFENSSSKKSGSRSYKEAALRAYGALPNEIAESLYNYLSK